MNFKDLLIKISLAILAVFLIAIFVYALVKNGLFSPAGKKYSAFPISQNFPFASTVPAPAENEPIFQAESRGCGHIFVYKINQDNTAGISVAADKQNLNLSASERTFAVGKTNGLKVEILIGENIKFFYCNDAVHPNPIAPKKFIGQSGQAIISASEADESLPFWQRNYQATVILKDVRFTDESGKDSNIIIDELIFQNVNVGGVLG